MKPVMIIFLLLALTACEEYAKETHFPLPPELADCKVFDLVNSRGRLFTVMRCPHSTTSAAYRAGKLMRYIAVESP